MELRRSPRYELDQQVTVTNLEDKLAVPGRLANFSTNGVRFLVESQIPLRSLVKVEWDSTLLLGEVIYCRREGSGYSVGMELEHALYDIEKIAAQTGAHPARRDND